MYSKRVSLKRETLFALGWTRCSVFGVRRVLFYAYFMYSQLMYSQLMYSYLMYSFPLHL
jgi:hypothetical protein